MDKKEEIKQAKLVEVTTQTAPAMQLETGEIVNEFEMLIRIYNKILAIEKTLL